jgi:hypothetical protein
MLPTGKEQKQRERWEKMKRRGRLFNLALNILVWIGCYGFVRLLHILCFRWGWLKTAGSTSSEDLFFAILTGVIVAKLDWSDLKRKFEKSAGEGQTLV